MERSNIFKTQTDGGTVATATEGRARAKNIEGNDTASCEYINPAVSELRF